MTLMGLPTTLPCKPTLHFYTSPSQIPRYPTNLSAAEPDADDHWPILCFLFIEVSIEKNGKNLIGARTVVSLLPFFDISIPHVYYAALAPVLLESPGFWVLSRFVDYQPNSNLNTGIQQTKHITIFSLLLTKFLRLLLDYLWYWDRSGSELWVSGFQSQVGSRVSWSHDSASYRERIY